MALGVKVHFVLFLEVRRARDIGGNVCPTAIGASLVSCTGLHNGGRGFFCSDPFFSSFFLLHLLPNISSASSILWQGALLQCGTQGTNSLR